MGPHVEKGRKRPHPEDTGDRDALSQLAERLRELSPQDRQQLRDLLADNPHESDSEVDS